MIGPVPLKNAAVPAAARVDLSAFTDKFCPVSTGKQEQYYCFVDLLAFTNKFCRSVQHRQAVTPVLQLH